MRKEKKGAEDKQCFIISSNAVDSHNKFPVIYMETASYNRAHLAGLYAPMQRKETKKKKQHRQQNESVEYLYRVLSGDCDR